MIHDNRLWASYVRAVAGDMKQQDIAECINKRYERGDVKQGTVSRWLDPEYASAPEPARVAAFAQAFNKPVLQAFLAAGLLEIEDVERGVDESDMAFVLKLQRAIKRPSRQASSPGRRKLRSQPRQA